MDDISFWLTKDGDGDDARNIQEDGSDGQVGQKFSVISLFLYLHKSWSIPLGVGINLDISVFVQDAAENFSLFTQTDKC